MTYDATFEISAWDESPYQSGEDGAKMTLAVVGKTYSGDLDGASDTRWLMSYAADGTATFVGLERVEGTVGGRKGSFVLQHVGAFADGAARARLSVVPGSGTDGLGGVTGDGDFTADPGGRVVLRLTFAGA